LIKKIKYIISNWFDLPLVKQFLAWSKQFVMPGFGGVGIYYIVRFIVDETKRDSLETRSNSIAFSFFVSMFPAIIFLFTLIPHIDQDMVLANLINDSISKALPTNASSYLLEIINDITMIKRQGLLSVGFILAMYFSSSGILSLMTGFDKSHLIGYKKRSFFRVQFVALSLTIILATLVLSSGILIILGDVIINFIDSQITFLKIHNLILGLFRYSLAITLVYITITILYKYGPSMQNRVSFLNVGSIVATLASVLSSVLFAFFVNNFSKYNEIYGSIGALLVLLLWLKINAFILLIGFELNISIMDNKLRSKFTENVVTP